ncbi:MAG: ATP-binding protein, partial [Leptospirales bacterium]|nr:ATP-binding protein [Leptospirales bacterium]
TELICKNVIEGRYVKISRNFFSLLKETFNSSSDSYGQSAEIERELHEVDVLVLDDFGVQKNSQWEQETLYNLVDARYENEKFTIFTSNHNPLKVYGELSEGRVLSRLREMCHIIELSGDDYRLGL